MRQRRWALLGIILLWTAGLWTAPTASAQPDAGLSAEQAELDAGADLSSRARRALFRARAQQDNGAFAEAAEIVTTWLAGDPDRDHHLLRFNLAVSYLALDRPAEALVSLEKSVALAPRFARGWLRLGEAAYELGKYRQAGEAFGRAYDLSPDRRPEILYYAGVSLLSGGQPKPALSRLILLLDLHAAEAGLDWYQALLAAAIDAGQPERATVYLERLLAAQPNDPRAWDLAYRFHAGRSDYEQAAAHLTLAGYLRELSRDEQEQLGDLYAVIGVPLQAARYYEQAFAAASEPQPDEYRKLATAWLSAHELEAARATLTAALAARPTTELWALSGDLEYTAEDYAAALEAFTQSTATDSAFGRGYLMMGYCALELGRETEAREYLARAVSFPDQAAAARALVRRLDAP
jgi:tetratricopeptide (TPR) repeat protein